MIEPRGEDLVKKNERRYKMVFEQDPAARSTLEVVTTYAGLHAVWSHLIAINYIIRNVIQQRESSHKCHAFTV